MSRVQNLRLAQNLHTLRNYIFYGIIEDPNTHKPKEIRPFFTLADEIFLKTKLNLCLFNGLSRLVERQEAE